MGPSAPTSPARSRQKTTGRFLEGHFLEDLVVGPLQERAVDVHDRSHAGLGHAGGERDRVALADPDIEELFREGVADSLELVPLAHGGGDHRDLGVAAARLEKDVADGVRVACDSTRS